MSDGRDVMEEPGRRAVEPSREEVVGRASQEQADLYGGEGGSATKDPSSRRHLSRRTFGAALVGSAIGAIVAVIIGAATGSWALGGFLIPALIVVGGVLGGLIPTSREDGRIERAVEKAPPERRSS